MYLYYVHSTTEAWRAPAACDVTPRNMKHSSAQPPGFPSGSPPSSSSSGGRDVARSRPGRGGPSGARRPAHVMGLHAYLGILCRLVQAWIHVPYLQVTYVLVHNLPVYLLYKDYAGSRYVHVVLVGYVCSYSICTWCSRFDSFPAALAMVMVPWQWHICLIRYHVGKQVIRPVPMRGGGGWGAGARAGGPRRLVLPWHART